MTTQDNNRNQNPAIRPQMPWMKKLEVASGRPIDDGYQAGVVYILVDCSSSMSEQGKMQQAQRGSLQFAQEALKRKYAIGIIEFDTDVRNVLKPTTDIHSVSQIVSQMTCDGSTAMDKAIRLATEAISPQNGIKVLCIVTDGMPDDPNATLNAARYARKSGIDIMAVGTDDADQGFLKKLSSRDSLVNIVPRAQLVEGMASMARLLPGAHT